MADALDQSENLDRRLLGKVGFDESPLPFAGDGVLADQLLRSWIDDANPEPTDVHDDACADVVRRNVIVGAVNLDGTVEMDGTLADLIVFKARCRQRQQEGPFFFEHRANLPFGRAVDARERPPLVPAP